MNSPYGTFRTRTFAEIFAPTEDEFKLGIDSAQKFIETYINNGIPTTIRYQDGAKVNTCKTLFYLLYAKYGNSNIANSDETQFIYRLFSIVFMYGPTWEKRLEIQDAVRNLTEAELQQGSKQIFNHAYNPGQAPSTDGLTELDAINEQNTNNFKRSKLEAYGTQWDLLATDVTSGFINRFADLFLKIVQPQAPLLYVEEEEDD